MPTEQKFDRHGDPINCHAVEMGKIMFLERIEKEFMFSVEVAKDFWDDFKHNNNQTFEEYLEEIA